MLHLTLIVLYENRKLHLTIFFSWKLFEVLVYKYMEKWGEYIYDNMSSDSNIEFSNVKQKWFCHFSGHFFTPISHVNCWIFIQISQKFVPWGSINDIPALIQSITFRRASGKPWSEPVVV